MSDYTDDDVEVGAVAAFVAFGWNVERKIEWDEAPLEFQITLRKVAEAVLDAVAPAIAARARNEALNEGGDGA